jgi:hypothetical protein
MRLVAVGQGHGGIQRVGHCVVENGLELPTKDKRKKEKKRKSALSPFFNITLTALPVLQL